VQPEYIIDLFPNLFIHPAFGRHLSQNLWITIASSDLNNASVVAVAEQTMHTPEDFFVLKFTGIFSNGFTNVEMSRSSVYRFQLKEGCPDEILTPYIL